ncbi:unnamed protein product [Rotaria sp. Silwood1]|nr:unnamed protein product [Rotaria sp. Silwood1]
MNGSRVRSGFIPVYLRKRSFTILGVRPGLGHVQLRNVAKFFAHLIFNKAILWGVLDSFYSIEEGTTSSAPIVAYYSHPIELNISDPLPLDVAVIDASILLYSTMFICVSNKYRLNIIKNLARTKQSSSINDDNVNKSASTFVMQTLSHQNFILCCAADETLDRLTQVICDGHFVADIAQICFDYLKEFHDVSFHIGYSLVLECLHRYIDGIILELIKALKSRDLSLRRVYVSYLRQLSQRKAKEVRKHTNLFMKDTGQDLSMGLSEFRNLEETDAKLCSHIQDTLVYMLEALGTSNLTHWLQLCKDILADTTGNYSIRE